MFFEGSKGEAKLFLEGSKSELAKSMGEAKSKGEAKSEVEAKSCFFSIWFTCD